MLTINKIKNFDWILFILTIVIAIFGVIMVFSSSYYYAFTYKSHNSFHFLTQQIAYFTSGFILMVFSLFFPIEKIKDNSNKIYIISNLLLVLIIVSNKLDLDSEAFLYIKRNSEIIISLSKIGTVLSFCRYIQINSNEINMSKTIRKIIVYAAIPLVLLLFQFNYYEVISYITILLAIMLSTNIKFKFLISGLTASLVAVLIYPMSKRKLFSFDNISNLLGKLIDPLRSSYGNQMLLAQNTIFSGGLLGVGLGRSISSKLYLDNPYSTYIFSIISEELGFIGAISLISMYGLIIYRLITISENINDLFSKCFIYGIIGMLVMDIIGHIVVNLGYLPNIIKIPLPFISYGESNVISYMLIIGLILGMRLRDYRLEEKNS